MTRKFAFLLSAGLIAAAGPLGAQSTAPYLLVETGESFHSLGDAVNAIGDGDGTIRIAPGRYRDCAVQEAGRVAFIAEQPGSAVFDGGICEDKAALVLRGRAAHVEGLVFANMRVADGNGAGIRIEKGDFTVSYTHFRDSQSGILSASDPSAGIAIDRSTFTRLGKHPDGNGAHSLYIGGYGSLIVTNSRFEEGTGGHYLKSRAPSIEVLNSSFDDSRGSDTNYMIDLSNGATGRIAGNTFVQGIGKENYGTLIAVAPEGAENSSAGLIVERNDAAVAPGFRWSTTLVGDWSGEDLVIRDNKLGPKIALVERR